MSKQRRGRKGEKLRIALIITCVVLSLILIGVLLGAVYINSLLNKATYVDSNTETTKTSEQASSILEEELEIDDSSVTVIEATIPEIEDEPVVQGENVINILMIGQDRRPGQGTQRSDSMILVTFNKSTGKITLTSFMRDQYVRIPGYGNDKLCHAYAYGGMALLNQTLYDHFGVEIDGNVEVDFSGFTTIVNILGGVEVELTKKEANYLNKKGDWNLTKGTWTLTGEQALEYSRIRKIDSDYKRAERQRKLLLSLIEEYKGQDMATTMKMVEEFLPLVTTDIPKNQVLGYAVELFPMLSDATIETLRIPVDGTFTGGYVRVSETHRMWCQYDIDFQKNRDILREVFAES